jgi:PAS domain S-box-containing protein
MLEKSHGGVLGWKQRRRRTPDRRHHEEPLHDAVFVQLAHDLADALVIADADGAIIYWNAVAAALFGWSSNEAVGQSLDLIIPERPRERHWSGYRRAMTTGHSEYAKRLLEVPALRRDEHTISIAFTVTLLFPPGERQPFAIAVLRDDTDRWQARRRLEERIAALEPRQQVHASTRPVLPARTPSARET